MEPTLHPKSSWFLVCANWKTVTSEWQLNHFSILGLYFNGSISFLPFPTERSYLTPVCDKINFFGVTMESITQRDEASLLTWGLTDTRNLTALKQLVSLSDKSTWKMKKHKKLLSLYYYTFIILQTYVKSKYWLIRSCQTALGSKQCSCEVMFCHPTPHTRVLPSQLNYAHQTIMLFDFPLNSVLALHFYLHNDRHICIV